MSDKASLKNQIGAGFTAAMLIGSLTISFAAVLGQGLFFAWLCAFVCIVFSAFSEEGRIIKPDILLFTPFFYIFSHSSPLCAFISLSLGSILYCILEKKKHSISLSSSVSAGIFIALSLCTTVIITNVYFGIGVNGSYPFQMLLNYYYIGFHPNFMGLLTGTVTLFTMITYPFKFKKLSKFIPPAFITIFIPYVLNLFLNPVKELTCINESQLFTEFKVPEFTEIYKGFEFSQVYDVILGAVCFTVLLTLNKKNENEASTKLAKANIFSLYPVSSTELKAFSLSSAVISLGIITVCFTLFPVMFTRIPMHSVGAMLIVASWQALPFGKIKGAFAASKKQTLAVIIISIVLMLVFKPVLSIPLILAFFGKKGSSESEVSL